MTETLVAQRALDRAAAGKTLPLAAIFAALTNREPKPVRLARPGNALTWVGGPRVPGGQSAQGFWSSGTEASSVVPLPADKADQLAVALAQRNRQKSALWFTPGEGPDTLHVVSFASGYPRSLARVFQKHGVTEFTITQNPVAVHVVDQGTQNAGAVKAAAAEAGGAYEARPGKAEFRTQLARKRDTDPRARAQELKAFLHAAHYGGYQTGDLHPFADWLREVTGNPDDPRAHVVQNALNAHGPRPPGVLDDFPHRIGYHGVHVNKPLWETTKNRRSGLLLSFLHPRVFYNGPLDTTAPATAARVQWTVPVVNSKNPNADRSFYTLMKPDELHDFIDKLPGDHQQAWRDHAVAHGLHDTREKS